MTPRESCTKSQVTATNSHDSRTNLIRTGISNKPIGIRLFGSCFQFSSRQSKTTFHRQLVLLLTFIAYAAFHMGRRPLTIVKNVLSRNCSNIPEQVNTSYILPDLSADQDHSGLWINLTDHPNISDRSCSWAPFDDEATANQRLAILDSSFLIAYALLMFVSGIIAERMNLRYFIVVGTLLSGLGLIAFGLAYPLNIHSMTYFIIIQLLSGAAQSTGWPVVVTCIGNWFEPKKRGLVYGLWNSHTNLGNILGATIAGFFVETDWGLSFIVPGAIMIGVGVILFLFLAPTPIDVDLSSDSIDPEAGLKTSDSVATITSYQFGEPGESAINTGTGTCGNVKESQEEVKAVSFLTALKIPGVIEYSICLFFSKLVSYTFLYWLPKYISSSTSHDSEGSAYLSTPFDIGGIAGAILAGYLSDKFNSNGLTCNVMLLLAIPSMFIYQKFGSYSNLSNITLQLLVGSLVNGPYCLITTSVSADLGEKIKDGRAMATVAAIIDGMGSIGAVLGPLFAGFVASSNDWGAVFIMLMLADVFASLCLLRITIKEVKKIFRSESYVLETKGPL